jgi:hypothetical protein
MFSYKPDQFYVNEVQKISEKDLLRNNTLGFNGDRKDSFFLCPEYFRNIVVKEKVVGVILSTYRLEVESVYHDYPALFLTLTAYQP